jgi:RNA polymerase sigma-70 factor (ECF subfamily)
MPPGRPDRIQSEEKALFFEQQRRRLARIAYGLLGSMSEAEDAVQDAYIRFELADTDQLHSREAWLTTVVTRIAIDRLRSASHQRELYPGTWLPEPILDLRDQEQDQISRSELSVALLFLLERLEPLERAVFLLREVFEIPYRDIAEVVDKSDAACRQMYVRARARLQQQGGDANYTFAEKKAMVDRYAAAILENDEQKLIEAVTDDVIFFSDSGGKVPAALNPIYGVAKLVRFINGLTRKLGPGYFSRTPVAVNGEPGILVLQNGEIDTLMAFRFRGNRISAIYGIRNPDKLTSLRRQLGATSSDGQSPVKMFTL